MRTDEELYNEVYNEALNAKSIVEEFTELWRQQTPHNAKGMVLAVNLQTSLPNSFQNTFTLLCSDDIWINRPFGAWAKMNGVTGPLLFPLQGDIITKMIAVFRGNKDQIRAIFALHKDEDRDFLDNDIANIRTTVVALRNSLNRWKELFN
ncbi:MAG: hypothetical protein EOP45_06265 [Sphingobacteriaceae bacterium]|nr:MAG: hypothetical protein EOP45_06265 [Sphingobacteriaceae bacterium]